MGWNALPKSERRHPGNKHSHDDSRPDDRTGLGQDFAKLVPSVPQDEVQKWEHDEREEPEGHADVVHLCTVKSLKENGGDGKLGKTIGETSNGEGVTDLGSLEVISSQGSVRNSGD